MIAASPKTVALKESTNQMLATFQAHQFKLSELESIVPTREPTERYSQDQTGNSENGLMMDSSDKEKIKEDLAAYKGFVSELKFAFLEMKSKQEYVKHIIDSAPAITIAQTDAAEKERLRTKAQLKERKSRARQIEQLLRAEGDLLESNLEKRHEQAALTASLVRECESMEMEINQLRNKRNTADRMTIAEATQLCDDQCTQLTTFASQSAAATHGIKETKPLIGSRKRAIEKLESGKNALLKEEDEWRRRGANDERTEEGCRWTMASTAFYQSLLGIKSATSMGSPPNEIRLVYSAGEGVNEDERTLSIVLDGSGRMIGASLIESAIAIDDIVEAGLINQDMQTLVQEVRSRITH